MIDGEFQIYADNQGVFSIRNTDRYTHPRFSKFLDLLNTSRLNCHRLPRYKNSLADSLSRFCLDSQPTIDLHKGDALATDILIENLYLSATQLKVRRYLHQFLQ